MPQFIFYHYPLIRMLRGSNEFIHEVLGKCLKPYRYYMEMVALIIM